GVDAGDAGTGGVMGDAPQEIDCTGKPDGTDCGGGSICIQNMCLSSRCGDGCSKCHFECLTDGECDDKNVCTGTETCDKSMPGKQLCKAGTPPPAAPA